MSSVYDTTMVEAYLRGAGTARLRGRHPARAAAGRSSAAPRNLVRLPDEVFTAGLEAGRTDARGLAYPLDERLDLIVFTG